MLVEWELLIRKKSPAQSKAVVTWKVPSFLMVSKVSDTGQVNGCTDTIAQTESSERTLTGQKYEKVFVKSQHSGISVSISVSISISERTLTKQKYEKRFVKSQHLETFLSISVPRDLSFICSSQMQRQMQNLLKRISGIVSNLCS
jgi:hypothetical protein